MLVIEVLPLFWPRKDTRRREAGIAGDKEQCRYPRGETEAEELRAFFKANNPSRDRRERRLAGCFEI